MVTVSQRHCPRMDLRIPGVAVAGRARSEKRRTPLIPERVAAPAGASEDALTAVIVTVIAIPAF